MIKFFTYGTFCQEECRHHILKSFRPQFIRTTTTAPEYKLLDLGLFPGMIKNGDKAVVGELYDIAEGALTVFDMIESHPTFFRREEIKLADGSSAISYLFQHSINSSDDEIITGDWKHKI